MVGSKCVGAVLSLVLAAGLTGCSEDEQPAPTPEPSTSAPVPVSRLTFGAWGRPEELAAYRNVVNLFNAGSQESQVELEQYDGRAALVEALRAGDVPDVFMISRQDLGWLREAQAIQPLDELLDERAVDFGDEYSRDALEAFAVDRALQCMPYGIAPTVVFYNTDLIDFERMARRGLDVSPEVLEDGTHDRWTFEQFRAAAEFATRPRRNVRGFHVAPTLHELAPFVYGAGGQVFDDEEQPTSLAFSSDDTRSALERVLPLLRDATLTLSDAQLARASAVEWFKRDKLGMLLGTRELVPELRQVRGLDFDVMPMPTIDDRATIGDITGICVNAASADIFESADFLVHLVSAESVRTVARTGYLQPANQTVALSENFLEPGRQPRNAQVFTSTVPDLRFPPLIENYDDLQAAVSDGLSDLLTVPLPDLVAITTRIDNASRRVLPQPEESETPTDEEEDGEE